MWTYWIMRTCGKFIVFGAYHRPMVKCNIGPYWTRDEAERVLHKWTK